MVKSAKYLQWKKDLDKQRKDITDVQSEPRYLLTVYQKGDETFSNGDWSRKEPPRRYYVPNASLLDVKETIQKMNDPHWHHENLREDSTEEERDAIPFEEKTWSIIYDFHIEPMTKELEDMYLEGVMMKRFQSHRRVFGTSKELLTGKEFEKNFEEGFEEDTFVVDYSESAKQKFEEKVAS